ncbi:MAG: putative pyridoxal-dependent aspartate 1-decarboxylase [Deltaproteobacteria bacterium]|nr:putative pyridoxal-dependent aspartate 1-decarboxylase [Deltaproteobacteria bacterium]
MTAKEMRAKRRKLVADWEALMRTFIKPENEATKTILLKYMEPILFGLHSFLNKHVGITEEVSIKELADQYKNSRINPYPEKKLADVITDLIENIAPHAVNIASPYFVGHMTSAIPFFMVHLKTITAALNQNVVKLETSKVVSVVEKQVLAKIHRLIYRKDDPFYEEHIQNPDTTLGCFTDGGTLANTTAMWVARNAAMPKTAGFKGIESEGLAAAYRYYGLERCVILVSRLGHYSLSKACGLLGIGNENLIPIDVDNRNKINIKQLRQIIRQLEKEKDRTKIMAVVGIAGTTETGNIDPLRELADICAEKKIHYHVDAAWGGPTLMSDKYAHLLDGIKYADSVTIDGHKQFYMPMTCGMVYFKDPHRMDHIAYHARYVNRPGSVDLGIKSLSGSREANSLILDSTLKIMGSKGFALLINHGIETAREFAKEIKKRPLFQLISPPELNILTYRICPEYLQKQFPAANQAEKNEINETMNYINQNIQRCQREAGKSFVSRTTLQLKRLFNRDIVVFRCVIMNPMTDKKILNDILDEQEEIFNYHFQDILLMGSGRLKLTAK